MLGYRLNENSFIRYDVEMSQTNPTLVELTDTEIRLDPYLAERGNLLLKPYSNLNNNLFTNTKKACLHSMLTYDIITSIIPSWNQSKNKVIFS